MIQLKTDSPVAVIGAGTMGNGIAHVFAQYGYPVTMIDISADAVSRGMNTINMNLERMVAKEKITATEKDETFARIRTTSDMEAGVKDAVIVIEAATENVDLKLKIFESLNKYCKPEAILASNTSSISITKIAAVTNRPEQVIGMHFMNPVPVMKLVEIINGYATSADVCAAITDLTKTVGKIPCAVNDYPGFIANRILMPMINEAIYSLYEG